MSPRGAARETVLPRSPHWDLPPPPESLHLFRPLSLKSSSSSVTLTHLPILSWRPNRLMFYTPRDVSVEYCPWFLFETLNRTIGHLLKLTSIFWTSLIAKSFCFGNNRKVIYTVVVVGLFWEEGKDRGDVLVTVSKFLLFDPTRDTECGY